MYIDTKIDIIFEKLMIIVTVLLVQLTFTKLVTLPTEKRSDTELQIRMGSLLEVREPEFNFTRIQKREVWQNTHNVTRQFPPCVEQAPEITFTTTDQLKFQDVPTSPSVIYKFEDIRYSQYVLDMLLRGNVVYVMFGDAHVMLLNINEKKAIVSKKEYEVEGVEGGRLEMGYFVEMGNRVVFVNGQYMVEVREDGVQMLTGYWQEEGFQTAVQVEEFIGVAYAEAGVKLYSLDAAEVALQKHISNMQISSKKLVLLTDMLYQNGTLYLLDKDSGLLSLPLQTNPLSTGQPKYLYRQAYCSIMHLHETTMYLICQKVIKLQLNSREKRKILSTTNMNVREIYADGNVVGLVGRNVLEVFYLGREVEMFEDVRLDKILIKDSLFLGINQHGLKVGKYEVLQPYITCSTTDESYVGFHTLLFKTTAQCNQTYFQQNSISTDDLNIEEGDDCLYSVQMRVDLWEAGEVFNRPLLTFLIVWLGVTVFVFFCYILSKCKVRSMNRELEEYEKLTPATEQHSELVEEASKKSYGKHEIQEEVSDMPPMGEQTHDIE